MTFAIALLLLGAVAGYLMTPDERRHVASVLVTAADRTIRAAFRGVPSDEPFDRLLRARTRWTIVTPLLIAANAAVFARMLFDGGSLRDAQTLVDWGGNIALRTTNGEWWRLIASMFVHGSTLHLLATIVALVPLGFILERAVGPLAFATTYVAAGTLGSIAALWTTPATAVSVGASASMFGIYGLLLATLGWCLAHRSGITVPVITMKRVAVAAAVFLVYNLLSGDLGTRSELVGLAAGFACGLVAAQGVTRGRPSLNRTLALGATTAAIALASAVPIRGVADVAPDIARVLVVEERTAKAYDAAVANFRKHRITADALARTIDGTIVPALREAGARLRALRGVPPEHAPIVEAAQQFIQLREQSWQRRAQGLLQSDTRMLREAEEIERAAFETLRTFRPTS